MEESKGITTKLGYYFEAVEAAGGSPVAISLSLSKARLAAEIGDLDAFVLPGSCGRRSRLIQGAGPCKDARADANREKTDFGIIEHAFASGKPVLAICYGCQSLNVCLGGSLYQDIASELRTEIQHSKEGFRGCAGSNSCRGY